MSGLLTLAAFLEQLARLVIDHGIEVPADLDEYRIGLPTVHITSQEWTPVETTEPFLFLSTDHGAREWWPGCKQVTA